VCFRYPLRAYEENGEEFHAPWIDIITIADFSTTTTTTTVNTEQLQHYIP
jgi:hypothetical protein